ncbi:MAG: ABC transporter permease [Micromonosporaceae bacterium]|nr:ABC transporter permease [Micromonosporaceae bacterium]
MTRAIRSELLKIRTTNTWWLMGLGMVLFTGLALLINGLNAHFELQPQTIDDDAPAEIREEMIREENERYSEVHSAAGIAKIAANMYTSGQFFGVLFIMILGGLIVTNEYFHQTATATFLTIPHRTKVIVAKLFAAVVLGFGGWLLTTVINLATTAAVFNYEHISMSLDRWDVHRTILLNLAAFAVWAILGVALGTLIRSQIGTVVTGCVVYLIGLAAAEVVFGLVHAYLIKEDWVITAEVIVPSIASMIMVTPGEMYPHAAPQWVGAAVLIGYALVAGVIGTLITRRRDIS